MEVFAKQFLEEPTQQNEIKKEDWNWEPENKETYEIYASGAPTKTQASTYASEKDDRSDDDRPDEGMLIA